MQCVFLTAAAKQQKKKTSYIECSTIFAQAKSKLCPKWSTSQLGSSSRVAKIDIKTRL